MQLVSDADLVQLISLFIMTTSCRLLFGVYCEISSATMTVVTAPNHGCLTSPAGQWTDRLMMLLLVTTVMFFIAGHHN